MKDGNVERIKEIILKVAKEMNIKIDKIILFGSRARGDFREDSDYDILVVTEKKLEKNCKYDFITGILRNWAALRILDEKYNFDLDIIVVNKETFELYKNTIGDVIGFANLEGIAI